MLTFWLGMLQDHIINRDICLIGGRGSGKTMVARNFAHIMKFRLHTLQMFKDMTSRDLIQRRATTETGDTIWINSPIVTAALNVSSDMYPSTPYA
jgi:MoxR-like ATPase